MELSVLPIKSTMKNKEFDLFENLILDLERNQLEPKNGDVVVLSSKYVAISQGRTIMNQKVISSPDAKTIGAKFRIKPFMAELILRESDNIFGGIPGFVITSSDNILAPNAGIDRSNADRNDVILYPYEPYLVAEQLKRKFLLKYNIHVGIIIADSRLMPGRVGTVGIAIACSGIRPVSDLRGEKDLYGNPLKVTFQAVADDLTSIANLKMGEGSDAIPQVIIRNSGVKLTDKKIDEKETVIPYEECVYVRGLGMTI